MSLQGKSRSFAYRQPAKIATFASHPRPHCPMFNPGLG
jgi:hypothetical protein